MQRAVLWLAGLLYRYAYPLYRPLYFRFKRRQDAAELALLREWLKPGDTVLDIGGNIGFYTLEFAHCVGSQGRVHVFEPDRVNHAHLLDTVAGCGNVTVNALAVSDAPGELSLYPSRWLNVDHRTYAHRESRAPYRVRADSIDHHLGTGARVDFIKIDIQGYEMHAFRGMQRTLEENPRVRILTELFPHGLRQAGSSVRELVAFFRERGFELSRVCGRRLEPLTAGDLARYEAFSELEGENVLIERRPPA